MTTEALNPELFLPPPLYIHLAPSNLPLLFPTPRPCSGLQGLTSVSDPRPMWQFSWGWHPSPAENL